MGQGDDQDILAENVILIQFKILMKNSTTCSMWHATKFLSFTLKLLHQSKISVQFQDESKWLFTRWNFYGKILMLIRMISSIIERLWKFHYDPLLEQIEVDQNINLVEQLNKVITIFSTNFVLFDSDLWLIQFEQI